MKDTNKNLKTKNGLNMGCKKGWFLWPIPACNGKYIENKDELGYVEQVSPLEAHTICKDFCKLTDDKLPKIMKERTLLMNKNIKDSDSCSKFCDNILEYIGPVDKLKVVKKSEEENKSIESYIGYSKKYNWCFVIIILLIILTILFGLIIVVKNYTC